METPRVWNLSRTLGSSFTYLEPVGQEVSPWKMRQSGHFLRKTTLPMEGQASHQQALPTENDWLQVPPEWRRSTDALLRKGTRILANPDGHRRKCCGLLGGCLISQGHWAKGTHTLVRASCPLSEMLPQHDLLWYLPTCPVFQEVKKCCEER